MASRLTELSSSTDDDQMTGIVNGLCNDANENDVGGDVAADGDSLSLSNDGMSEVSPPEVYVSTNGSTSEEDTNYEVQQAYRIFSGFLLDKHKGITNPFLHPIGHQEAQPGVRGVKARGQSQLRQSMCLQKIEKKFINHEYETITEFVSDFRLMLENCYRYHGVDHWVSKQAQKLELMLEQKLILLSRTLREKTTLAVTSKGHFGAEEDRGSGSTSLRRRLVPRSIATLTVSGHESIMVQALRLEEQQRVKEEKRQRELEKKEAEEMSAKEVDDWEQSLLSQAHPQTVDTLWELPAIGHFLCLAQRALNLPEVVFFELERCLLMPRCSMLLSKIMSSLLSPPHRRANLHRQPPLPYNRWESELRQAVRGWYRIVGSAHNQPGRAQKLGLCHQFFTILGEVSPMEEKPFHLLIFHQRVWLLKGLCDHVYETHKDVQDAVLAQPIHECRESILGYDRKDNSYIHFPHFCGADLRIYCQSPSTPPAFPFPLVLVKRFAGTEKKEANAIKEEGDKNYTEYQECGELERRNETHLVVKKEKMNIKEDKNPFKTWCLMKREVSSDSDSCGDSEVVLKMKSSSSFQMPIAGHCAMGPQEETLNGVHGPERFTSEQGLSLGAVRSIKADTKDPCLNVGEHSYTGRSPARSMTLASSVKSPAPKLGKTTSCEGHEEQALLNNSKTSSYECEEHLSSESTLYSSEEITKVGTEKKRRMMKKKKRVRVEHKQLQHTDSTRLSPAEAAQSTVRKKEKKKEKTEKKLESAKKVKDEPSVEPSFKLVCANLEDLRQLISKTEDELDDLESTKKKLGRWYYKKEAVKELHSTLIRLLNELSPWEPKLIKAYQRNRLKLKKEFDDFKNHPEYNNFVREEYISSSSSDDDDDEEEQEEEDEEKVKHYDFKQYEEEEDDQEFSVPRGLWSGGRSREIMAESTSEQLDIHVPSNFLNEHTPKARDETIASEHHSEDSRHQFGEVTLPQNKSRDSEDAAAMTAHILPKPFLPLSTIGLCKRYTPIPTLLAKSVGNKVTLMKQPVDCPHISSANVFSKGPAVSLPFPPVSNTKVSDAQSPPSCSQSLQQKFQEGTLKSQLLGQNEMTTETMALKVTQAKPTQTESTTPFQVIYRTPEGLGQLVVKDSPMKFSVHPVVDNAVKKMQQVVILPSKLLTQKTEEKSPYLPPLQPKSMASNANASPSLTSTDAPGFSIPTDKSSVSQLVPLKDEQKSSSPILPYLQHGSLNPTTFRGPQACSIQPSTKSHVVMPTPSRNPFSVSSDPVKTEDHKQELKTVCIRDSQSILVTTRCGNTGIVKVQTSSDQNQPGSFPTTPVITISPQLKAYLVSKTASLSKSSPSQTPSSTIPTLISNPVIHSHQQPPPDMKLSFTAPSPMFTTNTSSSTTTKPTLPASHDLHTPASLNPTNMSHLAKTASLGSHNTATMFNLPSCNSSSVPQLLKQDLTRKTGRKRACEDEGAQVTKFILVTPNSPSSSTTAQTKGTPTPTKAFTTSRVLDVDQTLAKSSIISMATGMSGQAMTTSLSSHSVKMGLGQPAAVTTETCYKSNNITLPSGAQIQLSGKTTTIGQSIGALSCSPIKSFPSAITTGHVTTSTNTLDSLHLAAKVSTTYSSQPRGIPSLPVIAPNSWRSALSAGNVIKQQCGSPAHVMNTVESGSANTSTFSTDCQLTSTVNSTAMETISSSSSKIVQSKTLATPSIAPASWNPVSTTSTVQQRIVINNSAPLAAGTQILLNNTCFVVPPQGLGPGNHVLIISQQVPNVGATCTGASVPFQAASHQTPTFPHCQARLPGVPTTGAPFVPCMPAGGQSLLTKNPPALPVVLGSISTKKAAFEQSGNLSGPPMEASGMVACPSEFGRVPVVLSPMKTAAPAFSPALAALRLAAPTQHECSSTILPAVATTFTHMSKPQSSVPAGLATSTSALHCSSPTQQVGEVPVTVSSIQTFAQVRPQVSPGTQTLATMAVSPTIGSVSRMQTLPIAAFPLITNHFHTKTALGGSSSTVTAAPLNHQPTALTSQGLEKHLLQTSTHSKWDPSYSEYRPNV